MINIFLYTYVMKTLGEVVLTTHMCITFLLTKKHFVELCLDAAANGMSILAKNRLNKLGKKHQNS